eukprot:s1250_g4.t2
MERHTYAIASNNWWNRRTSSKLQHFCVSQPGGEPSMARSWPRQPSRESAMSKSPHHYITGRARPYMDWVRGVSKDSCASPVSLSTTEDRSASSKESCGGSPFSLCPTEEMVESVEEVSPRTLDDGRRMWSKGSKGAMLGCPQRLHSAVSSKRPSRLEPLDQDRRGTSTMEQRLLSKRSSTFTKPTESATTPAVQSPSQPSEPRTVTVLSFQKAVSLAKKHNLSISTVKSALDEFRDLGVGREFLTLEEPLGSN